MATLQSSVRFFDETTSAINRARNSAVKASASFEQAKEALSGTSKIESGLNSVSGKMKQQEKEIAKITAELEDYRSFIESMPSFADGSKMKEDATLNKLVQQLDEAKAKYAQLEVQKEKHDKSLIKQSTEVPAQAPQPPPEPYKWQSIASPEVFQSTGIERLRQETESANIMVEKLAATQARISIVSQNTKLFPPEMAQDMEAVYQRINKISSQMQAIAAQKNIMKGKLNPQETDRLNASYERLRGLMDSALQEQNQLNEAMKRGDISESNKAYEKLVHNIDAAEGHIRDNIKGQASFNEEVKRGAAHADGLNNKLGGMLKTFLGFTAMKKGFDGTIGAAAELTSRITMMQGMFGNANIGKLYFDRLQGFALDSGRDIKDLTTITQQFLSTTKNTKSLMALTKIADRLAVKNPMQGLEGAGYALNEAMAGQFTSLKNRFNLSSSQLEPIKEAIKQGNMDGVIQAFDSALNSAGITDAVVAGYRQTAPAQFESIMNTIKTKFAETGAGALAALQPVMAQFSQWLQSPEAAMFFVNMQNGITAVAEKIIELGGYIVQIGGFFADNWSTIEPIVWGITAAFGTYLLLTKGIAIAEGIAAAAKGIMTTATAIATAAQWGFNAALSACPITWIIIAIAALIGIIIAVALYIKKLWDTNDDFALALMRAWNGILNFFDQVPIFFAKVWDAIASKFDQGKVVVMGIMETLANGVIKTINWIIDKLNMIPGVSIQAVGEVQWKAEAEANSFAAKQGREEAITKMEMDARQKAFDREQAAQNKIREREAKRQEEALALETDTTTEAVDNLAAEEASWNAAQVDNLGSIDNTASGIKDSVDKSDEELKWLRDVAEKEAVNRFTTASLAPQISFAFSGSKEEYDIDGIIRKIAEVIQEESDIAAEGIVGV